MGILLSAATGMAATGVIPGKAEVRATQALVSYSDDDGKGMPLKAGTILHPGTELQSEATGAADIAFDGGAGLVRMTGSTKLVLDKLEMQQPREGPVVEIQLTLSEGLILVKTEKLLPASRFEIKTRSGILGVRGGTFRIDATGKIEVLTGSLVFAHVPPGAPPVAHNLTGPPAVVFSPGEGTKPATDSTRKEIEAQLAARLRKR